MATASGEGRAGRLIPSRPVSAVAGSAVRRVPIDPSRVAECVGIRRRQCSESAGKLSIRAGHSALIIERYLGREVLRTCAVVLAVLVLVYGADRFSRILSDAAAGAVSPDLILRILALKLVEKLPVFLPLALYLAVLIGLGRLYRDSEVVAFGAGGIGLWRPVAGDIPGCGGVLARGSGVVAVRLPGRGLDAVGAAGAGEAPGRAPDVRAGKVQGVRGRRSGHLRRGGGPRERQDGGRVRAGAQAAPAVRAGRRRRVAGRAPGERGAVHGARRRIPLRGAAGGCAVLGDPVRTPRGADRGAGEGSRRGRAQDSSHHGTDWLRRTPATSRSSSGGSRPRSPSWCSECWRCRSRGPRLARGATGGCSSPSSSTSSTATRSASSRTSWERGDGAADGGGVAGARGRWRWWCSRSSSRRRRAPVVSVRRCDRPATPAASEAAPGPTRHGSKPLDLPRDRDRHAGRGLVPRRSGTRPRTHGSSVKFDAVQGVRGAPQ